MKKLLFLFLLLISTLIVYSQQFRKAPYLLYTGKNDQMLILWQLYSTNQCTFFYGTDTTYSDSTLTTTETDISHIHSLLLTGLKPGTNYYYKVQCGTETKTGSFITGLPDTAASLSFYAYGDTRTYPQNHNSVAQQILNYINKYPASKTFIIHSGDLVTDGNNEQDWDDEFFNPKYPAIQQLLSNMPYVLAVGNHEDFDAAFEKYFPYWKLHNNKFYYSFDYGPLHVIVIDQYEDYQTGSEQYNWLVNDLSSSTKTWKIIALHEPGWSAGGHSNNTEVQHVLQPLCEKYGVQFVIAGHNHYYARAVVNGVMHITSGGGGAPMYDCYSGYPNIVRCEKTLHFCKFDINGDSLTFTAIRNDGSVIESFTIGPRASLVPEVNSDVYAYVVNGVLSVLTTEQWIEKVEIYNIWGQQVYTKSARSRSLTIELGAPGIYLVKVLTDYHAVILKVVNY